MLEKMIGKFAFKRTREHDKITEVWNRLIYNTEDIIHLFPSPRIQPLHRLK